MKVHNNPELKRELMARLRSKYLTTRPEMPHLSELLYCLTRSYYDRFDKLEATDKELLLFSIGFGLESVLLRDADSPAPVTQEVDGVWLTPDYVALSGGELDLKSTRMYPNAEGSPSMGWPDTWIEQFKGYAYRMELANTGALGPTGSVVGAPHETVQYSVGILYLGGSGKPPDLECFTFVWTWKELTDNWAYVSTRKSVFMAHVNMRGVTDAIPTPFLWNKDWECRSCRYLLRCTELTKQAKEKTNG